MTAPTRQPAPAPIAEGWRVEIFMPGKDGLVTAAGVAVGKPVGWLNLNQSGGGKKSTLVRWRIKKAWRKAAYDAFERARLPRGLDRIYLRVEFRFPDRIHRDPANFELTLKPIVDALQPMKTGVRWNPAKKRHEPFVDLGWGVIPGDDPRYLVRGPEQPVGEPLGRANPIKGMVILHILPLPAEVPGA